MTDLSNLIEKLEKNQILDKEEYLYLIENREVCKDLLFEKASKVRNKIYGNKIYIRGLIEFTNYCKNNCLYCGIRRGNNNIERYRLTEDDILKCADLGYSLGFRTFVMQGGEDSFFNDEILYSIIQKIKGKYPNCAITLSLGERTFDSYK